ncbi:GntR family transcriptional regulator [Alistipes communis]|uniref:FadR/GntR family transcriptional regulator n=1 Tax=Alistipes communis TaxID=2585118 RepID=UPI001D098D27|nr:GntR family transcriptional regulator [Alistipes communis]MCB6997259.1 GntR family transcriptional regulator [Alistipes communis]
MKSGPQTPLRKHSLADTLAQRLQRRIAAGKFRTGERLPTESELMRMFGVGRSTVREAVRMLSDRGFLNVRQGAGTFVAAPAAFDALVEQRLRRADIRELDEVRKILEAAIVERATARRTPHAARRRTWSGSNPCSPNGARPPKRATWNGALPPTSPSMQP